MFFKAFISTAGVAFLKQASSVGTAATCTGVEAGGTAEDVVAEVVNAWLEPNEEAVVRAPVVVGLVCTIGCVADEAFAVVFADVLTAAAVVLAVVFDIAFLVHAEPAALTL